MTAIANQTSAENAAISLPVVANDPDGDPITFSATGLPSGLTIAPSTGLISGTLSYTSAGTQSVTVTATAGTLSTSGRLHVDGDKRRSRAADDRDCESNERGECGDQPARHRERSGWRPITFSATGLPSGLTIAPSTGLISGTLSYTSAGTQSVTVTATAGTLSTSAGFTWTVTNVDRAPLMTAIANQTSAENAAISLPVTASDPDGDALTFSATGLPPGTRHRPDDGA